MNRPEKQEPERTDSDQPEQTGPSLALLWGLVLLALIIAAGLAWLIILPFYRRIGH